jgi:hypothetical protein
VPSWIKFPFRFFSLATLFLFLHSIRTTTNQPNFGHSEVLIKMTDEMPLLLASRDKFVTLNIFSRKFSVDFPTREDWSTEFVDLVAPDGLVFYTDGSLCEGTGWVLAYSLTF